MHKRPFKRFSFILLAMSSVLISLVCLAQTRQEGNVTATPHPLKKFLQDFAGPPISTTDALTEYFDVSIDLNNDKKQEVIVYLKGTEWCGSGGCTMLILAPEGASYKVLTKVTITNPPIRVLAKRSHGWRSLGVWVRGGGIRAGYEAALDFDGMTYPSNPSVLPSGRLTQIPPGDTVISASDISNGKKLY
jgi:hypothetical protein